MLCVTYIQLSEDLLDVAIASSGLFHVRFKGLSAEEGQNVGEESCCMEFMRMLNQIWGMSAYWRGSFSGHIRRSFRCCIGSYSSSTGGGCADCRDVPLPRRTSWSLPWHLHSLLAFQRHASFAVSVPDGIIINAIVWVWKSKFREEWGESYGRRYQHVVHAAVLAKIFIRFKGGIAMAQSNEMPFIDILLCDMIKHLCT